MATVPSKVPTASPAASLPHSTSLNHKSLKLPLRVVLTVPFILQLLGAVGLVSYLSFQNGERSVNALANKLVDEVGNRVSDNLNAYIATPAQLNQAKINAIQLKMLNPTNPEGWEKFLWNQIQTYPSINITSIGFANGDYRAAETLSSGITRVNDSAGLKKDIFRSYETNAQGDRTILANQLPDKDIRTHGAFVQASKAPDTIWTPPYVSFLEDTLILSQMKPLRDSKNQLQAILIASLRLDYVGQYLRNLKISETGQVLILERDGNLIATSTGEAPLNQQAQKRERLRATQSQNALTRALADAIQTRFVDLNQIQQPQTFRVQVQNQTQFIKLLPFRDPHGLDWLVAVTVPESDFMTQIHDNTRNTIALSLGALALAVVVGILTAQWITRPIGNLNRAAKAIAAGDWSQTSEIDRQDEVGELSVSFSSMAQQLQQSFHRLEESNQTLETRVASRTQELSATLINLQATQAELVQSEKMAALGQLVAGIAHEINTPIGAIRAASGNSLNALDVALTQLPQLLQRLSIETQSLFFDLLDRTLTSQPLPTSKEKRQAKRALISQLEAQPIEQAPHLADTLVDMGLTRDLERFYPLFQQPQAIDILEVAYNFSRLKGNSQTIQTSVDRVSKIVFALKSYARHDHSNRLVLTDVALGLETVLTLYHNLIKQGITVVQDYQAVPAIWCYPDELNQVWNNLVHNAIQAMGLNGTLTLRVRLGSTPDRVAIQVSDSGTGIPDDIQARIFDPFFTTKPIGEGSGLGLDIVKKIIDKHQGTIAVESQPGMTCFTVELPIQAPDSSSSQKSV